MTARRGIGRPTREQSSELNDLVLDEARRIFCRNGFADASMDLIAQGIGVSKLTIYRRFTSKEALVIAVVDRDLARLRDDLRQEIADSADPLDALKTMSQKFYDLSLDPETMTFITFIGAEAVRRPAIRERFGVWNDSLVEPLIELVCQSQAAGKLTRDRKAPLLADILYDLIDGVPRRLREGVIAQGAQDGEDGFDLRWEVFLAFAAPR